MQGIQFANPTQVGLGAVPPEGPMAVPFFVDFSIQSSYNMDLTGQQFFAKISCFQTLYVDNSAQSVPVQIVVSTTGQTIQVPPGSFAYIPLLVTNKLAITVASASGAVIMMTALNIAMNAAVWGVGGSATVSGGKLQVQDATLDGLVSGGALASLDYVRTGDGATNIPRSVGTRIITGTLAGVARSTLITGAPGWVLVALRVTLDPNSIIGAAAMVSVTLDESTTGTLAVGQVFVPTAVPTGLTAAPIVIDISGAQITSKVAASTLGLTAGAALTGGAFRYIAQYAQSNFVGG